MIVRLETKRWKEESGKTPTRYTDDIKRVTTNWTQSTQDRKHRGGIGAISRRKGCLMVIMIYICYSFQGSNVNKLYRTLYRVGLSVMLKADKFSQK